MDSFPNLPKPGTTVSPRPDPQQSTQQPDTGPAVADPPPPAPPPAHREQPAQVPLNYGSEKDAGEFMTDADFTENYLEERNPLPGIVLGVGVALCYLIFAGYGYYAGGAHSAIALSIMVSVMLAVACATATAVGWVVCKVFGDDIGPVGALFLRFSSVASFQIAVFSGLMLTMGFFPAAIITVPFLLAIVVYIGGLDMLRAIVFSVILSLLNFMLFSFFAAGAITANMPA